MEVYSKSLAPPTDAGAPGPVIVHCRWAGPAASHTQSKTAVKTFRVSTPPDVALRYFTPPLPAHLSAGIGRTGCFIGSSIGCQQLRQTGQVDILETVCQLRLDR